MIDHLTRPRSLPGDVRTHFNLSTGGYTVDCRLGGAWRAKERRAQGVLLRAAYFGFHQAGLREYLASGQRNVHAWVYGVETPDLAVGGPGWRSARYSAASAAFVDAESGQPLPNDRSIEVYCGSRPNVGPDGKALPSRYRNGRATKTAPMMIWRPM